MGLFLICQKTDPVVGPFWGLASRRRSVFVSSFPSFDFDRLLVVFLGLRFFPNRPLLEGVLFFFFRFCSERYGVIPFPSAVESQTSLSSDPLM